MAQDIKQSVLDIDLNGPEAALNPYPLYEQVRAHDPVHWNKSDEFWYITRYADLMSLIRDPRASSKRIENRARSLSEESREKVSFYLDALSSWILDSDPPTHTRIRSLVNKAFTPRMIENMRSRIQDLVDEMLDKVQGNGHMDVIADLAIPLPGTVISDMLGIPEEDHHRFKKWSTDIAMSIVGSGTVGSMIERLEMGQKSFLELSEYFMGLIESMRGNRQDNLLSSLVEAEEAGDKLTERELVANCVLLMFAGHETTSNLIGNGTVALLENPEQKKMLQEDGGLIGSAVEELLRFDSPVQKTSRTAITDIEIGGKTINSGDLISLCYGSANRDEEQFEEPDRLDITRTETRHASCCSRYPLLLGRRLGTYGRPDRHRHIAKENAGYQTGNRRFAKKSKYDSVGI